MNDQVKTTIQSILTEAGLKSEDDVLRDQVGIITLARISKYEAEVKKFQSKYQTSFEDFERRLFEKRDEEDFEEEDDYLDWKFATEALKLWTERKKMLKDAGAF